MNKIIQGNDDSLANWIKKRLPHEVEFGGNYKVFGVERNGRIIAGFALHDYEPYRQLMQFTVASISPHWAHPDIILFILKYIFETSNVHRLSTYTYIENKAAIKMLRHVGFKLEATMDSFYGKGHHGLSFRMLRPEYALKYYKDATKFVAQDINLPPPLRRVRA